MSQPYYRVLTGCGEGVGTGPEADEASGTTSHLRDGSSLRGPVGRALRRRPDGEGDGGPGGKTPGWKEQAVPGSPGNVPSSPVVPRWGTSAGLWRRSTVWPAAPMTRATTPPLSSPPRGSSMQPRSSTSQAGTLPSTAAWVVGHHFALPSITPSGSMVRRQSPRGRFPWYGPSQLALTPINPSSCPTSKRAHTGFIKRPRVRQMFAKNHSMSEMDPG